MTHSDPTPVVLAYDPILAIANLGNWNNFFNNATDPRHQPFEWSHQKLIAASGSRETEIHKPYTVSGFSNWIFSIYRQRKNPFALARGRIAEPRITEIRLKNLPAHHGWELLHDGTGGERHSLLASELALNGQILTGSPDLVFRERNTGTIVIVEIKASNAVLPSDAWPNLRGQLWAYSKLDKWRDSPKMLLVGEVWDETGTRCRAAYGWASTDRLLETQNSELFIAFRHQVEHRMLRL
ncbi:hypothetical protein RA876_19660 (plasmid) [Rhodoferax antarcticus]|nr:hypothetical protein RA876_19660 [Rhodoferax antarcticus]